MTTLPSSLPTPSRPTQSSREIRLQGAPIEKGGAWLRGIVALPWLLGFLACGADSLVSQNEKWDDQFRVARDLTASSGTVEASLASGGGVYVAGSFTQIGGISATNIAYWNGSVWTALGGGLNRRVRSLVAIGGDLYAGGEFDAAGDVSALWVSRWDGARWSAVGDIANDIGTGSFFESRVGIVALTQRNGRLCAALASRQIIGLTSFASDVDFWEWDQSKWRPIGLSVRDTSKGYITESSTGSGPYATSTSEWIAPKWNDNVVQSMSVTPTGALFVHGDFKSVTPTPTGRVWDSLVWGGDQVMTGEQWVSQLTRGNLEGHAVTGTLTVGNVTYIAGEFSYSGQSGLAGHLIRVTPSPGGAEYSWAWASSEGFLDEPVVQLAAAGDRVWATTRQAGLRAQWLSQGQWHWSGAVAAIERDPSLYYSPLVITTAASPDTLLVTSSHPFTETSAGKPLLDCIARFDTIKGWGAWSPRNPIALNGDIDTLAATGWRDLAGAQTIVVGGSFVRADVLPLNHVALWNPKPQWDLLGGGIEASPVSAMIWSTASLYAAATNLYRLDGAGAWSMIPVQPELTYEAWDYGTWGLPVKVVKHDADFLIKTLASDGKSVVAGGKFIMNLGPQGYLTNLARWDGAAWASLSEANPDGPVWATLYAYPYLYVGGSFTRIGNKQIANLARYDGQSWEDVTGGTDGPVLALAAGQDTIVVAGVFSEAGGTPARNIARLGPNGWEPLGTGTDGLVRQLAVNGTDVYAAGSFTQAGGESAQSIARWQDGRWSSLGSGLTGGQARSESIGTPREDRAYITGMALTKEGLYVSGRFAEAGGKPCAGIALWTGDRLNEPPTVAFPAWPGNVFPGPANVPLVANASDVDGQVVSVTFYGDGKLLGAVTQAPYQLTWSNVPAGEHVVVAKAADNRGSTAVARHDFIVETASLPATIRPQPESQTVALGRNASFRVDMGASAISYRYQWYQGERPLVDNGHVAGARSAVLLIAKAIAADAGEYHVVVSTAAGSVTSRSARLEVTVPEVARVQLATPRPGDVLFRPKAVPLAVNATPGARPITEVWYFVSSERGAERVAINREPPEFSDIWNWPYNGKVDLWATAVDSDGQTTTSPQVTIAIEGLDVPPTVLETNPSRSPLFVRSGTEVTFGVRATGSPVLRYQWKANNEPLSESAHIKGAQTARLTITGATEADSATYRLEVSNDYGSDASQTIDLQVVTDVALRELPQTFTPGQRVQVRLAVQPKPGTRVYALEDEFPYGWKLAEMSEGILDSATGKVKFGPYFDDKPRTLTYVVTPPLSAITRVRFAGHVSYNFEAEAIVGDAYISTTALSPGHPADWEGDNWITAQEMTSFAFRWRRGSFDYASWADNFVRTFPGQLLPRPSASVGSFVTKAAAIWKNGETYYYKPGVAPPLCWESDAQATGVLPIQRAGLFSLLRAQPSRPTLQSALNVEAIRELPAFYRSGQGFTVTLRTNPGDGVSAYALEEQVPTGWPVDHLDQDGTFDSAAGVIRWGPFFDNLPRVFTYQVTPPAAASGLVVFSGLLWLDGEEFLVGGAQGINGGRVIEPSTVQVELAVLERDRLLITLVGTPGITNVLQSSTDLVRWQTVTNSFNPSGRLEVQAPLNKDTAREFFRALIP